MIHAFEKYHGAGNDFILIDNRLNSFPVTIELIANLCHRRFGIGADGLMLLESAAGFNFGMRYFNSDGKEGSMCGNGGRCISSFAHHLGIIGMTAKFSAIDGIHESEILRYQDTFSTVNLKMRDVKGVEQHSSYYFTDTGSPHHIVFVENLEHMNVVEEGKKIRYSERYPQGVNVNFVEKIGNEIHMRTYERGVEDETLACGTGATAVALTLCTLNPGTKEVMLNMPGGLLKVSCKQDTDGFTDIYLEGPVVRAFSGNLDTNTYKTQQS